MATRKYKFPIGSKVSMFVEDGSIIVSIDIAEIDKAKANKLPGNLRYTDDVLDALMFALVCAKPGRAKTYYTQLKIQEGGIGASLERKEKSLYRLALQGHIMRHQLDSPLGRKTYELWPAK